MTAFSFGEHQSLVEGFLIDSFDQLLALDAKAVAFFGGTFNPTHVGHLRVMETALLGPAEHLIVAVHSHNPAKTEEMIAIEHRLIMASLTMKSSDLKERLHLVSPNLLDGIQNAEFEAIVAELDGRGTKAWVVMGADAVKESYRTTMRHLPHIITSRPGYKSKASDILTGEIRAIDTIPGTLAALRQKDPSLRALVYQPSCGGIHEVSERENCGWPLSGDRAFLLFSPRIEGHEWQHVAVESAALLRGPDEGWILSKEPLSFDFDAEPIGWIVSAGGLADPPAFA